MISASQNPNMMVVLEENTVASLLEMRASSSERLDAVVARLIANTQRQILADDGDAGAKADQSAELGSQAPPKYFVFILGQTFGVANLAEVFATAVDKIWDIAPEAIENLSKTRTRCRYHVSNTQAGVHPGQPHLGTLKTSSGWWISKNVSAHQTNGHLEALCRCANLTFGTDIRFVVNNENLG